MFAHLFLLDVFTKNHWEPLRSVEDYRSFEKQLQKVLEESGLLKDYSYTGKVVETLGEDKDRMQFFIELSPKTLEARSEELEKRIGDAIVGSDIKNDYHIALGRVAVVAKLSKDAPIKRDFLGQFNQ